MRRELLEDGNKRADHIQAGQVYPAKAGRDLKIRQLFPCWKLEFKDVKIPMGIMATEVILTHPKYFQKEHNAGYSSQYGCSWHLQPHGADEHVYVDGGVRVCSCEHTSKTDVVIAVNLNHYVTSSSLLRKSEKGRISRIFCCG